MEVVYRYRDYFLPAEAFLLLSLPDASDESG